ncbi:hypothetical protein [Demetria terragena]|uniref:hypothetical protein n=1 Tax=Demetria terragena TaxID=63959 RepID=UPI0012EA6E3C|nr:hypothetical protein [Demetria terragena]
MSLRWQSGSEQVVLPDVTRERVRGLLDVGRYRTLLVLGAHGPEKAHVLAKHTRLSTKETVGHLLALRDLELIERDLDATQDRWAHWQVIRGSFDITQLAQSEDAEDHKTYVEWLGVVAQHQMIALGDWRRDWDAYPAELRRMAISAERILVSMSDSDLDELHAEIEALAERWHRRARQNYESPDPEATYRPAFLFSHMFPLEPSSRER